MAERERFELSGSAKRKLIVVGPVFLLLALAGFMYAMTSIGPALLVLAGGVMLVTIGLFWGSLRVLSGDIPLPSDFEQSFVRALSDDLTEKKRTLLRALKDLESEHAVGKIDDDDYRELDASYREQAKAILRELDRDISPLRERAEQFAQEYLKKERPSLVDSPKVTEVLVDASDRPDRATTDRSICGQCDASNEPDATFCKACGGRLVSPASATEHHAAD